MSEARETSFADMVLEGVSMSQEFEPTVYYDRDGDCIEWIFGPDGYYGERIDGFITVYLSRETGKPVGALIKNVRAFVEKIVESAPGFKTECRGEGMKLEYLLSAGLWRKEADESAEVLSLYLHLRDTADAANTRVALEAC